MKKKLILLPLLALTLAACDLNLGDFSQNAENTSRERSSLNPNDVAIKVLNLVSLFPDVGDSVDLSEYVNFDTGFEYQLSDYTFTSSDNTIIKVENYKAECLKQGYCVLKMEGPGINTPIELSFYVGSIAGEYVPEMPYSKYVSFTFEEPTEEGSREYNFKLDIKANEQRGLEEYHGTGKYVKDGTPFLVLDFDANAPKYFSPVSDYLDQFGL